MPRVGAHVHHADAQCVTLSAGAESPGPGPDSRAASENKVKGPALSNVQGESEAERPTVFLRPAVSAVTRVVVGVDGSGGSAAALCWAAAEAVRRQAGLRIVSAWEEPAHPGAAPAEHPAQAAARLVQEALARVLSQQHYPRRVACAALRGAPGAVLLSQAGETGLLVLGGAGGFVQVIGPTGLYCLQRGSSPLVLVPPVRAGDADAERLLRRTGAR